MPRVPCSSLQAEAHLFELPTGFVLDQQPAEGGDGRAVEAVLGNDEVAVFVLQREEAESGLSGDPLDGHTPVGELFRLCRQCGRQSCLPTTALLRDDRGRS